MFLGKYLLLKPNFNTIEADKIKLDMKLLIWNLFFLQTVKKFLN